MSDRQRIFGITWLSYFGFYLCRKNFSVIMPLLRDDLHLSPVDLANAIFAFSLAYAIGQFVMGDLADRAGGRLVVGLGMLASAAVTMLLGFSSTLAAILILQGFNGLAQASGWPGLIKMMSEWFPSARRGTVMAWWSTNYVFGGFLATVFATFCATGPYFADLGWRRAAWTPSAALAGLGIAFLLLAKNRPAGTAAPHRTVSRDAWAEVLRHPGVRAIAGACFFLKVTYGFLFWIPLYMTERLGASAAEAGYSASIFELVGFVGVLSAGYASDHWFGARRAPVAIALLASLAAACIAYPVLSASGRIPNLIGLALLGAFTFGPDTLIGGASIQDAVPSRIAATAAGFANGMGAAGQLVAPYVIAGVSQRFGWTAVFY
ncbi:MAG: MFS transporter, partial [Bryobacteraceae bacterium]